MLISRFEVSAHSERTNDVAAQFRAGAASATISAVRLITVTAKLALMDGALMLTLAMVVLRDDMPADARFWHY